VTAGLAIHRVAETEPDLEAAYFALHAAAAGGGDAVTRP
jgi:hypothetical protein